MKSKFSGSVEISNDQRKGQTARGPLRVKSVLNLVSDSCKNLAVQIDADYFHKAIYFAFFLTKHANTLLLFSLISARHDTERDRLFRRSVSTVT